MVDYFQNRLISLKRTAKDLQIRGLESAFEIFADVSNARTSTDDENRNPSPGPSAAKKSRQTSPLHIDVKIIPNVPAEEQASIESLTNMLATESEDIILVDEIKVEPEEVQTWQNIPEAENPEAMDGFELDSDYEDYPSPTDQVRVHLCTMISICQILVI